MKNKEAKALLEVCRPGGADASDPQFQHALQQAARDPGLARWFDEQRNFDADFARSLGSVALPADLKDSILAARKVVKPWTWSDWRARVAAAAALVAALASVGGLLATNRSEPFPTFRATLIEQAWDGKSHLDFESSDILHIKQWFARQDAPSDFQLPEALRDARLIGGRVIEADGKYVPMICLADGPKHIHLFVIEGTRFTDPPPRETPDFQKCGAWKTASWQHGDKTYVLSGMKFQTFVSKFRKGGRWTMSG
jgi:anti-sigma factor RsiW